MQKKSTDRISIGPKITPQCHELMTSMFDRPGTGAAYIMDALPNLYSGTLQELAGLFSRGELMLMLDVQNGDLISGFSAGHHIGPNVRDGITLDELNKKWEIDGPALVDKMSGLTIFQSACLELWCQAFWHKYKELDVDLYVKTIAG